MFRILLSCIHCGISNNVACDGAVVEARARRDLLARPHTDPRRRFESLPNRGVFSRL
jgi:hypothetical protein